MVLYSIIPGRQGPSIMLLILCFPIKISMLQGVNIFLISHLTILHLKCQIGPELALSFMHDIELIRVLRDIANQYVGPVIFMIAEQAEAAAGETGRTGCCAAELSAGRLSCYAPH